MIKYKDYEGMSLPQVAWLLDVPPRDFPENYISATEIIQRTKPLVLSRKIPQEDKEISLAGSFAARLGETLHQDLERVMAKKDVVKQAATLLGISPKAVENMSLQTETRTERTLGNWVITGEFDLNMDGMVQDYKSMSAYSYIMNSPEKFIKQMSVYQWLNPEDIFEDLCRVHYFITNYSPTGGNQEGYPRARLFYDDFPLQDNIEEFLLNQLAAIDAAADLTLEELNASLDLCTDEELGVQASVFKYYANPEKTARATKNFADHGEAIAFMDEKGKGTVIEVKSKITGCKFCPAKPVCSQAQQYILEGLIDES